LARAVDAADFCGASTATLSKGASMPDIAVENPQNLREFAVWYRDYAERAGAPWVWAKRLEIAEYLERQAAMLENGRASTAGRDPVCLRVDPPPVA
jgi:hypothetical protein